MNSKFNTRLARNVIEFRENEGHEAATEYAERLTERLTEDQWNDLVAEITRIRNEEPSGEST